MNIKHLSTVLFALLLGFSIHSIGAADSDDELEDIEHRLVIQVSTDDPRTQAMALSNVVNLQKHYGIDNIEIELVAYGPGLGMLTSKSSMIDRITSLSQQEVTFTACGNTMDTIKNTTGEEVKLIKGVGTAQAGVARIMELQEAGWSYVRP